MSIRHACVAGLTFLGTLGAGRRSDLEAQEAPVRHRYIDVPAGTVGEPNLGFPISSYYAARTDIRITRVGFFDSAGDGLDSTLTIRIFWTDSMLAEATFTPESPGELVGGSRFKEAEATLWAGTTFELRISDASTPEPTLIQQAGDLGIRVDDANCAIEVVGEDLIDGYPAVVLPTFEFEVLEPLPLPDRRPSPPLMMLEAEGSRILVSWRRREVSECDEYPRFFRLFRSVGGEPFAEIVLPDPIRQGSYLDEVPEPGVQVCYFMRGVAESGLEGHDSKPVCLVPYPDDSPVLLRGDVNTDGSLDISDAVSVLNFLFLGSNLEIRTCLDAADSNDDGVVEISDPVYTLQFLMLGGPPPRPPYPACGLDVTVDELECSHSPDC